MDDRPQDVGDEIQALVKRLESAENRLRWQSYLLAGDGLLILLLLWQLLRH